MSSRCSITTSTVLGCTIAMIAMALLVVMIAMTDVIEMMTTLVSSLCASMNIMVKHCGCAKKGYDCQCKDKTQHRVMHNDNGSGHSCSAMYGHSCSTSFSPLPRSCSASSSRSVQNHYMDNPVNASPCLTKRANTYSDIDDGSQHLPMQDSGSIYMTFAAPSKKSK